MSTELGGFVVDPALQLPPNVKDLVSQLCEMGWLFNKVERLKREGQRKKNYEND
jgi:hypothetical protein